MSQAIHKGNAQGSRRDSTAISKSQQTITGPEMKKSAEKLHDRLQSANRTVGELSDHAGIRPVPVKR
jgi:hypothetical protein